ncbi:hypothetical protein [Nostoc sp. FACHB-145]|uniref:hypothetical protein n=1 Tax=Nostoc sp. FACHB-145 TaxID=2692836 RepID=UPI001682E6E4|nr:hypothetical protein [Nostoc sp. FACHB-145]MBD2472197.1 hypothetical protein [Nostoc sp. FACHB-145]
MTYTKYSHQQLRCKSLPQLKRIYSEIGCTTTVNDRRCKDSWRSAIARYQSAQLQKIDEQDIAQGEFKYIADQAQAIAPEEPRTTGNEIMVQIFNACEPYGLELLDDGIYTNNGEKLGEVGFTDGFWWFARVRTFCDSVEDAVWLLQIPNGLPSTNEYLQYHPLEQLSPGELQGLFEARALVGV